MRKSTFDKDVQCIIIDKIEDADICRKSDSFGNYEEKETTLFSEKMPVFPQYETNAGSVEANFKFDVTDEAVLY